MKVKFVTYNICHGEGLDGKIDIKRQAELIKDINPDAALLQEVDICTDRCGHIDEMAELAKHADMPYYLKGVNIEFQNGLYANGILSKNEIINSGKYLFEKVDEAHEQRNVTYGQITIGGKKIHLFCTHLSTNKEERMLAMNKLLELISKIDKNEYIILGGDFNFGIKLIAKHVYEYDDKEAIEECELLKERLEKIDNTELTWFSESGKACIDTFFYSKNISNAKFKTIKNEYSDHYPVVLEIDI